MKLLLKRYSWVLAAGLTAVACALMALNASREWQRAAETALTQARSNFQRDVIYEQWNAKYGPIYVPKKNGILPNPYVAGSADRDVTSTDGQHLTQVNPAYMTRLVYDLADRNFGVKGHITSLRPVRSENRPDAWESEALRSFEHDRQEASEELSLAGKAYFRLMKPLVTTEECLGCHEKQGYRIGDIRGGITIMVPMEPLRRIARQNIMVSSLSIVLLWMVGIGGIWAGAAQLRRAVEERDRAEREVAMLNQKLLGEKDKLEAANQELETFASAVSHDLRAPLSTIGGFCNLIREMPTDRHLERCGRFTSIIAREVDRMEKLVHALLDFSRLAKADIKRAPVNLSLTAEEIASELQRSDPARSVSFTIAQGAEARGDAVLLRTVMQNLLSNAWKFTVRQPAALIEFSVSHRNGEVIYSVKDNGVGFDNHQADRMFEAFQRLHGDEEFKGSGVGLATVKRIITRHGGRIWAEGEKGKRAVISFTLPS